jgi:hypothetical protein
MYIKDRMRVRDASGKEFDIEMDLKVEIQPARDRFYKTPFRPKKFKNKFSSSNFEQISTQKHIKVHEG